MDTGHNRHARIVSNTPGRTRIKIAGECHMRENMEGVLSRLRDRLQGHTVRGNPLTGSIVVEHPPDEQEHSANLLCHIGEILSDGGEGCGEVVSGCDHRSQSPPSTGRPEMSFVFPAAFGILSVVTLLSCGMQIGAMPWYFLAYIAYDASSKQPASVGPPLPGV